MNDKGIRDAIYGRIDALPTDAAFTVSDFADISDSANARQSLKALTDAGAIGRAMRGVYYKPRYSALLRETLPPDIDRVVQAVARARGWTIAPSGDTALNRIGLDTQVPAAYTYISTGPYVTLSVGQLEVRLKHAANKNLVGMSPTTLLVVQSLIALGRKRVGTREIRHIARTLSKDERHSLLSETTRTSEWVRKAIREIGNEETI